MQITTPPIRVKPPTVRKPAVPKPGIPDLPGGARLATAAAPANPYGLPDPYSSQDMQNLLGQYLGGYPSPLTSQQIQTQAQSEISPLVSAITGNVTAQTKAAADAIRGYTGSLQSELAGMNWQAPYQTAEQGQAAVDAALQQSLSGAGTSDADALASRLAVINDPSVAQAAQAVQANGVANAGTQVAQGSNALSSLLAQAAAAGSYGLKQPGIAGEYGLQQLSSNEQQGTNAIASQTAQIEQQLPQIISDLTSQSNTAATNKANAGQSLLQFLTGENDSRSQAIEQARQFGVTSGMNQKQLAEQIREFNATAKANGIKLSNDLAVAQAKAQTAAEAAAAKAAQTSFQNRLNFTKVYHYDPITKQPQAGYTVDPKTGRVVKAGTGTGGTKAATQGEVQSFLGGLKTPNYVSVSKPTANGSRVSTKVQQGVTYKMAFPQAYKRLLAMGVDDQTARQDLQTIYPRGTQGRAWLTNEEQAALRQAQTGRGNVGLAGQKNLVAVRKFKGHAYLTQTQAQVLQQAGMLPPVEQGLVNGQSIWYIKPGS